MGRPGAQLLSLEAALDARLKDHRTQARFTPEWIEPGRRWAEAVWRLAVGRERVPPSEKAARDIISFAQRPIFICGAHRSGTTLVRDLLDGHPALCVLPAEASHFGALEKELASLGPEDRTATVGKHWLLRLVNPLNQPPFWLLGRDNKTGSPYEAFAHAYRDIASLLHQASAPAPELSAVACAYARARGQALDQLAGWVEKTPGNERYLKRIRREFPRARILHVLRDPDEAALSYNALLRRANADAGSMIAMLWELTHSYRICRRALRSEPSERYLVLRYEMLVADRAAAMRRVARFLGIDDHPALISPLIAGLPTTPNSSHLAQPPRQPRWSLLERAGLMLARAQYRGLMRVLK